MRSTFLIVGGGTVGAVLATRLSEMPNCTAVLVEVGPDVVGGWGSSDIEDTFPRSSLNPAYFWPGLEARRRVGGAKFPYRLARVMGGGSSIMRVTVTWYQLPKFLSAHTRRPSPKMLQDRTSDDPFAIQQLIWRHRNPH
jgi:choline dehydrogenase-like flavoprotein